MRDVASKHLCCPFSAAVLSGDVPAIHGQFATHPPEQSAIALVLIATGLVTFGEHHRLDFQEQECLSTPTPASSSSSPVPPAASAGRRHLRLRNVAPVSC